MKCPKCKRKVVLVETDETRDCETCGYHYLEKCPNCGSLFDFYGQHVEVFDGNEWN